MKKYSFYLIVSIFCLLFNLAGAQKKKTPGNDITHFILRAYAYNKSELTDGNIALKNAKDGGVKSFGSQMAADHQEINRQLLQLARLKQVSVMESDTSFVDQTEMLRHATGAGFDSLYVTIMIKKDHVILEFYQNELATSTDYDLIAFIKKNLPILKDHLESATALAAQLNILTRKKNH